MGQKIVNSDKHNRDRRYGNKKLRDQGVIGMVIHSIILCIGRSQAA